MHGVIEIRRRKPAAAEKLAQLAAKLLSKKRMQCYSWLAEILMAIWLFGIIFNLVKLL